MATPHARVATAFVLVLAAASGCRSAEPTTGVGRHLVAEDLVLVDAQGKPWLAMQRQLPAGYGPWISLFDGDESPLELGIVETQPSEDGARPSMRMPMIRMQSPDGDSLIHIGTSDEIASVSISNLEGASLNVVAREDRAFIHFDPVGDVGDEGPRDTSTLVFRGDQVLLEIVRDGKTHTIDLTAITQATPPTDSEKR